MGKFDQADGKSSAPSPTPRDDANDRIKKGRYDVTVVVDADKLPRPNSDCPSEPAPPAQSPPRGFFG